MCENVSVVVIVYYVVSCVFFFFKQKTAYEMRISDWSSDVCSSDLKQMTLGGDLECGPPHAIVSSNNHVVLERTDYVTVTQNQRRAGVRICAVFEFDAVGKITAWREYWDKAHCAEQMGFTVPQVQDAKSEGRGVGTGGVSQCRHRWWP